jgi:uncharacterized protein (DUF58 family)
VEGLRTGGHRSPFHGFSTEFRQHRPYRAGDDLKHLDWKLYARSDRLYTRQYRETTNVSVMLVLDSSASLAFPGDGVSKMRYATVMAAALAWLASSQGHAVGFMSMQDDTLVYVPARGGRQHLRGLLARLAALRAAGRWNPTLAIARAAQLLQRRGVLLVLSDFYDDTEGTQRELRRVAQRGHDVSMLQVLSPDELRFPHREQVELDDVESGDRLRVDGELMADAHDASMQRFIASLRRQARRDRVEHALFTTSIAPERALRDYLLRRSRGEGDADVTGERVG